MQTISSILTSKRQKGKIQIPRTEMKTLLSIIKIYFFILFDYCSLYVDLARTHGSKEKYLQANFKHYERD